jgi:CubicO group peptidase (beta-lactamase class C family)
MSAAEMMSRLREAMAPHVESGYLPGYVAGVHRDGVSEIYAAGRLGAGADDPMRTDTIFRIASLSKPIAGALALSLVQDGALGVDDEAGRWLPELAAPRVLSAPDAALEDTVSARRPILVRDLLTMTAGFGMALGRTPLREAMAASELMPGPFPPPVSHDEFMARLGALPLQAQPGEAWIYHTCADVLGVLLERATGRSCRELLSERLLEPLGLVDTDFYTPRSERLPTAYWARDSRLEVLDPPDGVFARPPAFEAFGSGLVSTVSDYLAFEVMLADAGQHVLSAEMASLLGTDALDDRQRESAQSFLGPGRSWGMMVEIYLAGDDSGLAPGSFGWMGGTGTTAYVDPAQGLAGALFTQRAMDSNRATGVFKDFWRAVSGLAE